jgi:hypothetical protein
MCDYERNFERTLDSHIINVLETCLAVVLATICTRVSDFLGYHFNRWYYYRLPDDRELTEELTT